MSDAKTNRDRAREVIAEMLCLDLEDFNSSDRVLVAGLNWQAALVERAIEDAEQRERERCATWLMKHRPNWNTRWWDDVQARDIPFDWEQPSSDVVDKAFEVAASKISDGRTE